MSTNSQVAHIWAQQNGKDAKSGNMHSTGRSLYSYSTEIARFIEGKVVYTSQRYSVTTSSKHQNQIPRAVSHLESYQTSEHMKHIPDVWDEVAPILFIDMMKGIRAEIERLKKIRNVRFPFQELIGSINATHSFWVKYILTDTVPDPKLPDNAISIKDLQALWSNNATTSEATFLEYVKAQFGLDLAKKLEKEKLQEEVKRADMLKSLGTKIEEWRAGERNDLPYHRDMPVMLRIRKNQVETSLGAVVPVDHAKALYLLIKNKCRVERVGIGEFHVKELSADTLTVGCHKIPISEVEMIAKALGLVETKNDPELFSC